MPTTVREPNISTYLSPLFAIMNPHSRTFWIVSRGTKASTVSRSSIYVIVLSMVEITQSLQSSRSSRTITSRHSMTSLLCEPLFDNSLGIALKPFLWTGTTPRRCLSYIYASKHCHMHCQLHFSTPRFTKTCPVMFRPMLLIRQSRSNVV